MVFPFCAFPSAAGPATGTSVQMGPGEASTNPALDSLLSPFPDLNLPANQAAIASFTSSLAKCGLVQPGSARLLHPASSFLF